jgi:hypothetical protein
MLEPRVVVAHREDMWWLLSEAAQLEPEQFRIISRSWRAYRKFAVT